jgi:hypothetical protein
MSQPAEPLVSLRAHGKRPAVHDHLPCRRHARGLRSAEGHCPKPRPHRAGARSPRDAALFAAISGTQRRGGAARRAADGAAVKRLTAGLPMTLPSQDTAAGSLSAPGRGPSRAKNNGRALYESAGIVGAEGLWAAIFYFRAAEQ